MQRIVCWGIVDRHGDLWMDDYATEDEARAEMVLMNAESEFCDLGKSQPFRVIPIHG